MASSQPPQSDSAETSEYHKVQFFEEESNKMDFDSGDRRQMSVKEHIYSFFGSSYKGLLLFCMIIFSISTIYNLIQIFINIFTSWCGHCHLFIYHIIISNIYHILLSVLNYKNKSMLKCISSWIDPTQPWRYYTVDTSWSPLCLGVWLLSCCCSLGEPLQTTGWLRYF